MTQNVPICFVDTETTDVGHRRLAWEMAIIRREPDGTRKELQTFVEVDLADANPFALNVGRFYERHPLGRWLSDGLNAHPANVLGLQECELGRWPQRGTEATGGYVTQKDAALLWCRWTHGAHVIGAVPNFDTEVMAAAARAAGLLPAHHYHLADIENLIVGYLRGRLAFDPELTDAGEIERVRRLSLQPWKSDELFTEVGIVVSEAERHTALGDARACERAWDVVMGGAK